MRRRWYHLYALIVGIQGLALLVWLFTRLNTSVEFSSWLLFTVIALTITYFRVPIGISPGLSRLERTAGLEALSLVDLGLDGALLLGATLAGGPAFGGWVALIVGLVHSILPPSVSWHRPAPQGGTWRQHLTASRQSEYARYGPWLGRVATGLFNGGRNVIAVAVAWFAYQGMGGQLAPIAIGTVMTFALLSLYLAYILVRRLCVWPALLIEGLSPSEGLEALIAPSSFLIEFLPLPLSLLVSATFVHLGWPFFLTLSLAFIGLGAIAQQLLEVIESSRQQVDELLFRYRVAQAFARAPGKVEALCALAYPLCSDTPEPFKLEVGLYNPRMTHVHIRVYASRGTQMPPMYIPLTPMWRWLSELDEPMLIETEAQLGELPFTFPPFDQGQAPRTAILVPLLRQPTNGVGQPQHDEPPSNEEGSDAPNATLEQALPTLTQPPLGAIILQSPHPEVFCQRDLARLTVIAEHFGLTLQSS